MKKSFFMNLLLMLAISGSISSQKWTAMSLPDLDGKWTLTGIHFSSPERGWAVGYNYDAVGFTKNTTKGVVIRYENGSWNKTNFQEPSDNWTLHGVWFLNDNDGWFFGQDKSDKSGLLLHFVNDKWQKVDLSFVNEKEWVLYDVNFMNENEGWAAGGTYGKGKPVLLHFKNGQWKQEDYPVFMKQTIMALATAKDGKLFASGCREGEFGNVGISRAIGTFIISIDKNACETEKVPLLSNNIMCHDIAVVDDKNVFISGWMPAFQNAPETAKILYFNGKKWEDVEIDGVEKQSNLMSLAFSNKDNGWAVGYYPDKNKGLLVEFNKGKWTAIGKKAEPQVSKDWTLRTVSFDGNGTFYSAGSDNQNNKGIILKLFK